MRKFQSVMFSFIVLAAMVLANDVPRGVIDPLSIEAPEAIIDAEQTDYAGTPVSLGTPEVTGGVGPYTVTNDAPESFPLGQTIVTWTVTDSQDETADDTQEVTVVDTTPPSFDDEPLSPVTVEQSDLDGTPVELDTPAVSDICDTEPTVTGDAPATFPLGATTVTWFAMDYSGNTAVCVQLVTVQDTTPPTFTSVPDDVTVEQTSADGALIDIGMATATDICDATPTITNDAPAVFPLGTTTVTWMATDASANSETATQSVTVEDTTPPEIDTRDIVKEQTDCDGTPVSLDNLVNDICDTDPTVGMTNVPDDNLFPLGETAISVMATDASANSAIAYVTVCIVDTTPPTIGAPGDKVVDEDLGNPNGTAVDLGEPTVSDICDADPDVTNDGPDYFRLGTTEVTWTATDASANSATDSQLVTVNKVPETDRSYAVIKVYKNSALTEPAEGKIGGTVYLALEAYVAPNDTIASVPTSLHVEEDDTSVHALKQTDLTLGSWNASFTKNTGTEYVKYVASVAWNTTASPLGHNGSHTISAGQVSFQPDPGDAYENGPDEVGTVVENLVIRNVTTSNGNAEADYILYDSSGEGDQLNPSITFNFADANAERVYQCVAWLRPTLTENPVWNEQNASFCKLVTTGPGQVTFEWNDINMNGLEAVWGPYTFDIGVFSFANQADATSWENQLDSFYMKAPYCLWVDYDEALVSSHYVNGEEVNDLLCKYRLNDQSHEPAAEISLVAFDIHLHEMAVLPQTGLAHDQLYDGPDGEGILVYTPTPNGTCEDLQPNARVVIIGEEDHRNGEMRDHQPNRMLARNRDIGGIHYYRDMDQIDALIEASTGLDPQGDGEGNMANAIRHAAWAITECYHRNPTTLTEMAQAVSYTRKKLYAHEDKEGKDGETYTSDSRMDLHNDEVGLAIYQNHWQEIQAANMSPCEWLLQYLKNEDPKRFVYLHQVKDAQGNQILQAAPSDLVLGSNKPKNNYFLIMPAIYKYKLVYIKPGNNTWGVADDDPREQ